MENEDGRGDDMEEGDLKSRSKGNILRPVHGLLFVQ